MEIFYFILTQAIYLIFLILLVNASKKHLFSNEHNKIININSKDIFIPENPTYNELYIQTFNKKLNLIQKYKAIAILPYSDKLISKNGMWDLFLSFYKKRSYLENYLPKTFNLHNFYEKKAFNKYIYHQFNLNVNVPKIFFLKKNIDNKKGIKIFRIKNKEDIIELYNIYFQNDYKIIQELVDNLQLNKNRITIMRVYIFICKFQKSLGILKYKWAKLLYPMKDFDLMEDDSLISKSKENIKENLDYDIDFNLNKNIILGNQINKILELLFHCSEKIFLDNNILPNTKLFQHFGLDFILTNNGPKLLEINKNPVLTSNYLKNKKKEIKMKENMISEMHSIVKNEININETKYQLIKKIDYNKLIKIN